MADLLAAVPIKCARGFPTPSSSGVNPRQQANSTPLLWARPLSSLRSASRQNYFLHTFLGSAEDAAPRPSDYLLSDEAAHIAGEGVHAEVVLHELHEVLRWLDEEDRNVRVDRAAPIAVRLLPHANAVAVVVNDGRNLADRRVGRGVDIEGRHRLLKPEARLRRRQHDARHARQARIGLSVRGRVLQGLAQRVVPHNALVGAWRVAEGRTVRHILGGVVVGNYRPEV